MGWLRRLRSTLAGSAASDDFDEEARFHLEQRTEEYLRAGMAPDDARREARRRLGNLPLAREHARDADTLRWLGELLQDSRYAARLLRVNPGFAAVAILSLALGIGANTAIFQLLNAVRIRTLPVSHPEELVDVRIVNAARGRTGDFMGPAPFFTNPLWEQLRDRQQAFASIGAWSATTFELASGGETRPARGLWVSGRFFETIGVPALLGRTLTAADDRRGCATPSAVISYGFWQREHAGSPSVIGRSITLNAHSYEIVGATPASFFGVEVGRSFDIAVPLCAEPLVRGAQSGLDKRATWFLAALARLKPGSTHEQASAQLASLSPAIFLETLPNYRAEDAKDYLGFRLGALPGGTGVSELRREYESPLWLLLATTGIVLLIACANLANLMLARATAREREIAVRLALGASRGRLVRQLVAESFLIATIGSITGAILARWLSAFLVQFLSTDGRHVFVDLSMDWRVLAFTALVGTATCLAFGLMPAVRATAQTPGAAMKAGSRGTTESRGRFGVRRALVVVQIALSLVLVVGALLFVRSLTNLLTLDAGFTQEGILVAKLDLRRSNVPEGRRTALYNDLTDNFRRLSGVTDAAQAFIVPVSDTSWNNSVIIDGKTQKEFVNLNRVGDRYFKTMGTPLLAGRDFDRRDVAGAPQSAIVTKTFARLFFDGKSPIGRTFQIDEPPGRPNPVYTIVGLAADTKYANLRDEFEPLAFLASPQEETPDPFLQVVVRSNTDLTAVMSAITAVTRQTDPSIILQFQSLKTQVRESLMRERLMATLSGFFGGLAALIAMIGVYGVLSYSVARRRSEIGIRMALGADRTEVVRMVMREAVLLLGVGLPVGIASALAAAQSARALLFGLTPSDPGTIALGVAALATIALAASYLPARRASRLEPTIALREQ